MPSVQDALQFIQVSNIILLKSCTINYWFHQTNWGRTVLLKMEQIGKCESLFLTAEILNKTGKIYSEGQILKEGKRGWILDKLSTFLHQSTICFCVIWNLQKIGKNSTRASQTDLTQIHELLALRLVCFIVVAPSCLPPFLPSVSSSLWRAAETSAPLPLNTLVLFTTEQLENQDYCYNIQYFTPKYFSVSFLRAIIFFMTEQL